jgi:hypothetical protein
MRRGGKDVDEQAFVDLVVGPTMEPADWLRALGLAVAEVLAAIAEDIDEGKVPATVTAYSELHDYVDANEYMLETRTCGKVWGGADTADEALPFLNAVTSVVDAVLGQSLAAAVEETVDLDADEIEIRPDLRLLKNRRSLGWTINKGLPNDWPADVGRVYHEDDEGWMVDLDDGDPADEADIRRVLGLDD